MSLNDDIETKKTNSDIDLSDNNVTRDFEVVEDKPPLKRFWHWLTKDKERLGSIIFISLFIILIIVLASLDKNFGEIMVNIVNWFEGTRLGLWGIFLGVFLISIFGNFTIILVGGKFLLWVFLPVQVLQLEKHLHGYSEKLLRK
ncbi:MAG: hypothetical protein ACTSP5_12010 [Candidatus Heimdallarchaeota archaeon]